MDELSPEEIQVCFWWLALCGEGPARGSVGGLGASHDGWMNVFAIARGDVTEAQGMKEEPTSLEAAEILGGYAAASEAFHEEHVVGALGTKEGKIVV